MISLKRTGKNELRKDFQNENPESADPHINITVEVDPNERSCSEAAKKSESNSPSDTFTAKKVEPKNQNTNEKHSTTYT